MQESKRKGERGIELRSLGQLITYLYRAMPGRPAVSAVNMKRVTKGRGCLSIAMNEKPVPDINHRLNL